MSHDNRVLPSLDKEKGPGLTGGDPSFSNSLEPSAAFLLIS